MKVCSHCDLCGDRPHSIWEELMCHVPYAAISIAIGFVFLSIINFFGQASLSLEAMHSGYHVLFHAFHYLHVVVAVAGAIITFSRFSDRVGIGILVACLVSPLFCIFSDVILPSFAGRLLGFAMPMHICLLNARDALNWYAFLLVGLGMGAALLRNNQSLKTFSLTFHFFHILISSMASMFYMVAHGLDCWYDIMGGIFLLLFVAVVVPCTLSDVVVPFCCARWARRR
ncbi:MAG: hypothetical protein M1549_02740 [Candidatus Dependentiae bacterium]|nr:hypothetical protein [Candidatus Dependentiae bacterium]